MIKELLRKTPILTIYNKLKYGQKQLGNNSAKRSSAEKKLANYSYNNIQYLGQGKDGFTFKATNPDLDTEIVKVLSDFAKTFLPITKDVQSRFLDVPAFYHFEVVNNELIKYGFEELEHFHDLSLRGFARNFLQICDIELALLDKGFLIWDFGFSALNYMKSDNGEIKWVDYGGNAFLYLQKNNAPIKPPRKNLVYAKNDFVVLSVFLHWIHCGLGYKEAGEIMTRVQKGSINNKEAFSRVNKYIKGTSIEFILALSNFDLLTKDGWLSFKKILKEYLASDVTEVLESADINSVNYTSSGVEVRGYQNFTIAQGKLFPKDEGHEWAPSLKKWELVSQILSELELKGTYLDIGCNLGMYVYSANINFGLDAHGVDYNQSYVDVDNEISAKLNLSCTFSTDSFSELCSPYDCVSALGIIHHLFHRTENFNSLTPILKKFAEITNQYLIIEFPTENDLKAKKWTSMQAKNIKEAYSEENFLHTSSIYFDLIRRVDGVVKERPIYLFKKR